MFGLVARPAPGRSATCSPTPVAAAAAADVAVVVVGLTEEQETEAVDKSTLAPARRRRTRWSRRWPRRPRRTVVVVNAATPVLMPWADEVDAVALGRAAGPGGRARGRRRAARRHRAGRPAGHHVPGRRRRGAGLVGRPRSTARCATTRAPFIGYRGHFAGPRAGAGVLVRPRPGLRAPGSTPTPGWSPATRPAVAVTVTNTGDRDSREVVQVYFAPGRARTSRYGWSAGRPSRSPAGESADGHGRHRRPAVAALGHRGRRAGAAARPAASCWSPAAWATSGPGSVS